jgi:hypothetical protein
VDQDRRADPEGSEQENNFNHGPLAATLSQDATVVMTLPLASDVVAQPDPGSLLNE